MKPAADTAATVTVSMRVPVDLAEELHSELRRLHFETGLRKGVLAAELLREALRSVDAVLARLPVSR